MNAAEFVLLLKFCDFILHARLGEIQHIGQALQLGHAAQHARTVDHQLAHGVHHAVQSLKGDAHGLGLRHGRRLFAHQIFVGKLFDSLRLLDFRRHVRDSRSRCRSLLRSCRD